MLEWNLQIANQGRLHAARQMRAVGRLDPIPQVVVLLEASRSLFSCYVSALQAATGLTWDGVFQSHCARNGWKADERRCVRFSDEGVAILTACPMLSVGTTVWPFADRWHSGRAAARVALTASGDGTPLQVFATHLQGGGAQETVRARLQSIAGLKEWVNRFAGPAVIAGDFNQVPSGIEISDGRIGMKSTFADAWCTAGAGPGHTHPARAPRARIDYLFFTGALRVASIDVVEMARLSDHCALRATFVLPGS